MPSRGKDAELVALGVGQHDPGSIPLPDVHPTCAMSEQPSHLGVLVIRPEVEVQSALGLLCLIEPDEIQPRHAIRRRADLELVSRGVDDNPAKGVGPPLTQRRWIQRVDKYLFPLQSHRENLDEPGLPGTGIFMGSVVAGSLEAATGSTCERRTPAPAGGSGAGGFEAARWSWWTCPALAGGPLRLS